MSDVNPYKIEADPGNGSLNIHIESMDGYNEDDFYAILSGRLRRSPFKIDKIIYTGHPRPVLSMIMICEFHGVEIICP